ncbi:MAG: chemotaxis protein CheC [Anaerolineales bacterium]|jgi:chemotaxis protein CheC|nr:chemotaxis protein CheC [Anaerolineales bacterium]
MFEPNLFSLIQNITEAGVSRAAEGFSGMVGEVITTTYPSIQTIALKDILEKMGGPENEAVGIYIRVDHGLPGHMMLMMTYAKALNLVDLLLGEPEGTTQTLGPLERSALGEIGNLTCSFFLNAASDITGVNAHPSPPAVLVDMVGAILDVVVAVSDNISERGVLLQTTFLRHQAEIQADFWIIPDRDALNSLHLLTDVP